MAIFGEVLTAMVTPFSSDGSVDLTATGKLARHLVEHGSDGILVLGTTGESPTLTLDEKLAVLEKVLETVGGEVPVVAGTGSYSTAASIDLSCQAEEVGVDGIMLVTPYYNKPPQQGLYLHFKAVADSVSLPVMIYNVPGRTARNIEPETIAKLAMVDNIVAVKEASGSMDQVTAIRALTPPDFCIYSGDDSMTLPILSVGGCGIVSVASHLVGDRIKEMIRAYKEGRVQEAAELNKRLYPVFKAIFITTNPIPVKTALNMQGVGVGPLRSPLCELQNKEREKLQAVLNECDVPSY
ncbi:MAG: 4-hydroxy-tetrahydrodipicolinate synthase [Halanaerobium sp.]|nr:4-hydroxy-tetrahydrodipicolinate synthase [Halanaerobium sp.]